MKFIAFAFIIAGLLGSSKIAAAFDQVDSHKSAVSSAIEAMH
ncbi:hypothetical protein ACXWTF_12845 [Thiomicrolovo sp. ZZH C-3]